MVCGAGWKCTGVGRVRARFLKSLRVRGGFKFCRCGAGADKKFQPAQDSTSLQPTSKVLLKRCLIALDEILDVCSPFLRDAGKSC